LEKTLSGIAHLRDLSPRSKDYVLSFGERFSARILYNVLRSVGLNTEFFTGKDVGIVTDSNFGEAQPLLELSKHQVREKIEPLLERGIIPVITGYIAATQDGIITTLGRGGSDYTATIVGAAVKADEIWIWTDVDGLMTTDPKIVPSARVIPTISFAEAIEMAVFGAKAMHPRALEPAMEEEIPVRIRNSSNPKNTGTLVVALKQIKPYGIVKAITLIKDAALITVSGAGMVGSPGTAAKIFDVLGRNNINILMISQSVSEANISFVIQRNQLDKAINSLEIMLLGKDVVKDISAEDDVCIIAAVGAGMKGARGVASRIFGAVANAGVNVRMIAQGGSELNISFVVTDSEGEKAVRAIHQEFSLDKLES
ncbi:MAG TPA: aspartate kinase, partial [archaeon]|nr:aspartate kinase [archaeon]